MDTDIGSAQFFMEEVKQNLQLDGHRAQVTTETLQHWIFRAAVVMKMRPIGELIAMTAKYLVMTGHNNYLPVPSKDRTNVQFVPLTEEIISEDEPTLLVGYDHLNMQMMNGVSSSVQTLGGDSCLFFAKNQGKLLAIPGSLNTFFISGWDMFSTTITTPTRIQIAQFGAEVHQDTEYFIRFSPIIESTKEEDSND